MYTHVRTVKGLQPGFIAVVTEAALQVIRTKVMAARNPFYAYDYAEALDAFISILPPDAKQDITKKLGIDVDIVVEDALSNCETDPLAHPYANKWRCLQQVKKDLDKLLRIVFSIAHKRGLFVVERDTLMGRET